MLVFGLRDDVVWAVCPGFETRCPDATFIAQLTSANIDATKTSVMTAKAMSRVLLSSACKEGHVHFYGLLEF